jgi:CRP-like cAMP-binding protein
VAVPQNLLQPFPLFAGFTDTGLGIVAQICRLRDVPQGMSVFLQGAPGEGLFLVQSGQIEIVSGTAADSKVLCVVREGEQFGELALLRAGPRKVTARARTACRLIEMRRGDFNELLKQKPQACMKLMLNVFAEVERRFEACTPHLI